MKLVFFGTSQFVLPVLEALKESGHNLAAVFTQPDRRGGRKLKLIQSPAKEWALANNYPLHQPQNILDKLSYLRSLDSDLFIVVAYGNYLPKEIIDLPKFFSINIHPSLLPEYRGAAPANWAIIEGKTETGVTFFKLNEDMDAGDIILQKRVKIQKDATSLTLSKMLSELGAQMLLTVLETIEQNRVKLVPQNSNLVTYAPKLKKKNGLINWRDEACKIHNLIRGTQPWPGAFTHYNKKILKIHKSDIAVSSLCKEGAKAGEIVSIRKSKGITVKTGKGCLNILTLQLEGKKIMAASEFILGHNLNEGQSLGN